MDLRRVLLSAPTFILKKKYLVLSRTRHSLFYRSKSWPFSTHGSLVRMRFASVGETENWGGWETCSRIVWSGEQQSWDCRHGLVSESVSSSCGLVAQTRALNMIIPLCAISWVLANSPCICCATVCGGSVTFHSYQSAGLWVNEGMFEKGRNSS